MNKSFTGIKKANRPTKADPQIPSDTLFQIFFLAQDYSQNVEIIETNHIDLEILVERLNMGESIFIKNQESQTL